jgi:DNA-binding SARP family transcriptional activator
LRALLAILLLRADQVVSADALIEELWRGRPPASAPKLLQLYVSQLRRVLGASGRIATRARAIPSCSGPRSSTAHASSASSPRVAQR